MHIVLDNMHIVLDSMHIVAPLEQYTYPAVTICILCDNMYIVRRMYIGAYIYNLQRSGGMVGVNV